MNIGKIRLDIINPFVNPTRTIEITKVNKNNLSNLVTELLTIPLYRAKIRNM